MNIEPQTFFYFILFYVLLLCRLKNYLRCVSAATKAFYLTAFWNATQEFGIVKLKMSDGEQLKTTHLNITGDQTRPETVLKKGNLI